MNLLEETIEAIKDCHKTTDDVMWVGSKDGKYAMNWEDFEKIADVDYYDGFGTQAIAKDLVVVFHDDSYLYRHGYDGAECWELASTPQRQLGAKSFTRVKGEDGSETLDELNNPEEEW